MKAAVERSADDVVGLLDPGRQSLPDRRRGIQSDLRRHSRSLAGHGYIEEWGMSQFVRDTKIAMIYEGTNGIQALDLVGRKLMAEGGRYWQSFFAEIDEWCGDHKGTSDVLDGYIDIVLKTKAELMEGVQWLGANGMANPDNAGAASHDFLHIFGLTAIGYMWLMMTKEALAKADDNDPHYKNKLITARYWFDRIMPDSSAHLVKLKTGADNIMDLPAEAF